MPLKHLRFLLRTQNSSRKYRIDAISLERCSILRSSSSCSLSPCLVSTAVTMQAYEERREDCCLHRAHVPCQHCSFAFLPQHPR